MIAQQLVLRDQHQEDILLVEVEELPGRERQVQEVLGEVELEEHNQVHHKHREQLIQVEVEEVVQILVHLEQVDLV
jgi:hypothetical protein